VHITTEFRSLIGGMRVRKHRSLSSQRRTVRKWLNLLEQPEEMIKVEEEVEVPVPEKFELLSLSPLPASPLPSETVASPPRPPPKSPTSSPLQKSPTPEPASLPEEPSPPPILSSSLSSLASSPSISPIVLAVQQPPPQQPPAPDPALRRSTRSTIDKTNKAIHASGEQLRRCSDDSEVGTGDSGGGQAPVKKRRK
jgi:hypothetical protein